MAFLWFFSGDNGLKNGFLVQTPPPNFFYYHSGDQILGSNLEGDLSLIFLKKTDDFSSVIR